MMSPMSFPGRGRHEDSAGDWPAAGAAGGAGFGFTPLLSARAWRSYTPAAAVGLRSVIETEKRVAAQAAAALVQDGMRVGLGTGSTVAHLLPALAARGLRL